MQELIKEASLDYVDQQIESLEKELKKLPKGKLIVARNGKGYKWYLSHGKKPLYLPKSERKRAEGVARRMYLEGMLKDFGREREGILRYLELHEETEHAMHFLEKSDEYRRLALESTNYGSGKRVEIVDERIREWLEEEYEPNPYMPENLIYRSATGKMLRSKSECLIDMLLDKAGIIYKYECPVRLGGRIVYPDFTIMHPRSGEFYYWEHMGLFDDAEYRKRACEKIYQYGCEGVYPNERLILTYETARSPLNAWEAEQIIREKFLE